MKASANGPFEVTLAAQQPDNPPAQKAGLGRRSIDKRFHGDLQATSHGEMLAAGTEVPGSAGYVALERVSGTLHGRSGSFVLQHNGTMDRGTPTLTIDVVPDSATAELVGLRGSMRIIIDAQGGHRYEFDYTLPDA
jgi:hypothetical protein